MLLDFLHMSLFTHVTMLSEYLLESRHYGSCILSVILIKSVFTRSHAHVPDVSLMT